MDRREFLTARAKAPAVSSRTTRTTLAGTGIAPYSGVFDKAKLTHLLKRTLFGASQADLAFFNGKSLDETVDTLINPTAPLPDPPVKEYVSDGATTPDTGIAAGTTWVNDPNTDGTIYSRRKASLKKWWTGLMISQDRSVREKMTLFWHNHFSTEFADVADSQFLYKHHALLRANALENFKTLVRAITVDPAMLIYLGGSNSTLPTPNENYARELQELFTVGKENTPNYDENDVKAAARALTGWQTSTANIASSFSLNRHDKTAKAFSSFYSFTIPARSTANSGDLDIDDLINMIFTKKAEVSRFIVKKIYRWFCYYDIDANIESNVILPLAQIFVNSNWNIKPVLSALFKSEHFYDDNIRGSVIKSPVDLTIGMCREFSMAFPNAATNYDGAYAMFEYVRNLTAPMGQSIGDPPNVAGWPALYQEPQFHEIWLNADTLPKRNRFTDFFTTGTGYTRNSFLLRLDVVGFTKNLSSAGDPDKVISDALEILFQVPVSDNLKGNLLAILLKKQTTKTYWTDAWNAYLANPVVTGTAYKTVDAILRDFYKYLLNLPEYQLA